MKQAGNATIASRAPARRIGAWIAERSPAGSMKAAHFRANGVGMQSRRRARERDIPPGAGARLEAKTTHSMPARASKAAMRRMLVIMGLATGLASLSGLSVIDLSEQRLDCNQEPRRNIIGPRRVDVDLYRRVVERRQLYVRDCMASEPQEIGHTGSASAPLPPRRPLAGQ